MLRVNPSHLAEASPMCEHVKRPGQSLRIWRKSVVPCRTTSRNTGPPRSTRHQVACVGDRHTIHIDDDVAWPQACTFSRRASVDGHHNTRERSPEDPDSIPADLSLSLIARWLTRRALTSLCPACSGRSVHR